MVVKASKFVIDEYMVSKRAVSTVPHQLQVWGELCFLKELAVTKVNLFWRGIALDIKSYLDVYVWIHYNMFY